MASSSGRRPTWPRASARAAGRQARRLWAFGAVLYEMLSGRRLFDAPDVTETLAAVLTAEPKWDALPDGTPAIVRRLLTRCLTKDPRQRLDSLGAARLDRRRSDRRRTGDGAAPIRDRAWTSQLVSSSADSSPAHSPLIGSGRLRRTAGNTADLGPLVTSIAAAPEAISAFVHGFALSPDGATLVYACAIVRRPARSLEAPARRSTRGGDCGD